MDDDSQAHEDAEQDPEGKSKSQAKREMHALQKLGESLVALSSVQLRKVPMPEALQDAVEAAKEMRSRGALKRQMQFIGKVMRRLDAEPIAQALAQFDQVKLAETERLHEVEQLRADLLEHGDAALKGVLQRFPSADRMQLRQLVRQAQKSDNIKYRRSLFQMLKALLHAETDTGSE